MILLMKEFLHHTGCNTTPVNTWNPNDTCFDWKRPSFGWCKPQNRGQTGSREWDIYHINWLAGILPTVAAIAPFLWVLLFLSNRPTKKVIFLGVKFGQIEVLMNY